MGGIQTRTYLSICARREVFRERSKIEIWCEMGLATAWKLSQRAQEDERINVTHLAMRVRRNAGEGYKEREGSKIGIWSRCFTVINKVLSVSVWDGSR